MSLENLKITDEQISQNGVTSAPDKLSGTAAENKAVFDRLVKNIVAKAVNAIIADLTSASGAGEIGALTLDGKESSVQALLTSTSILLKKTSDDFIAFDELIKTQEGAQNIGALTLEGEASTVQSVLTKSATLLKQTSEDLKELNDLIKSFEGAASVGAKSSSGEATNVQTLITSIEMAANKAVKDAAEAIKIANLAVGGDLSEYVKKTDLATVDGEAGLVKLSSTSGVVAYGDGLGLQGAYNDEIDMRLGNKAITPQNFDRAVKSAMTSEEYRSALTDAEKASAQAWLGIDTSGGGASPFTIVTKSVTLNKDNWSEWGNMSGVSMGYIDTVGLGRTPNTTKLKVLLVDINQYSTLEQRKASEEACIYASFFAMEPDNEYDWYVNLGITGTVPTVDIPITVTAIFEEATS